MRNFEIENKMYRSAEELIEKRYPHGWGGAGVVRTDKDNYFTSVAADTANSAATLCIETGAIPVLKITKNLLYFFMRNNNFKLVCFLYAIMIKTT